MHFTFIFSILLTLGVSLPSVSAYPRHESRAMVCFEDNTLRALERFASEAAAFCPKYLASSAVAMPSQFAQLQATRVSSACSCFEKTAGTIAPTIATSVTPSTTKTQTTSSASTKASITTTPSSTQTSASTLPIKVAAAGNAKRGLVYDYNSKTAYGNLFKGSAHIGFGSNWGSKRAIGNGVTLDDSFVFVPTLRVDGSLNNNDWVNDATAAISSGSKYLFSSNEPDNAGQANLSPARTAEVYKKYMNQFQGKAMLATPAVTNGGGSTGLNFLDDFVNYCTDCHFDMINVHYYVSRSDMNVDQAVSAFKTYIEQNIPALQAKHPQLQGKPIMVGEFWLWGASEAEGGTYLQKMMPYLDGNSAIIGYQAFGGLWTGNFISNDGTGLTPAGTAYKNY